MDLVVNSVGHVRLVHLLLLFAFGGFTWWMWMLRVIVLLLIVLSCYVVALVIGFVLLY